MRIKMSLLLLASAVVVSSCEDDDQVVDKGQNLGDLFISKEKPQPGDELDLKYSPAALDGESPEEVEAFYHYFVGPKAYPQDIEFTDSSGVWKARVKLPDSATAVVLNISKDGRLDNNNKKGFVIPLFNAKREMLSGSKASMGYFYNFYGSGYEVRNDSALALLEQDLQQNPELNEDWDKVYAMMLYASDKAKAENYIQNRIKERKGANANEEDLVAIYSFFEVTKNKKAADSLQQVIVQKFPKSETAKQKYLMDFRAASDLASREKIFEGFQSKFGAADKSNQKNSMLTVLASAYAKEANWEKFDRYAGMMTDKGAQASLYNDAAWQTAEKGGNLDKAAELSAVSLKIMKQKEKPEYWTKTQFEENSKYTERIYLDTYSYVLMKQGKLKEAIEPQERAVADGLNSGYNERYVALLLEAGQVEKARDKAAEFIRMNAATRAVKEDFKKAYVKSTGSEKGFKERLTELEKAGKEKAIADIKKDMMNEEAPAFTLKDLEGKEVSLASLKGKTVILDFWATWCGPCINSFPGMKVAVEKYKDDPNVEFLFVDTFENTPTREQDVKKFIAQNNYPFDVLFDEPIKGSYEFTTTKDYNISGIPAKVVIGPQGNIRFKKVGYGGNNEELVQEIDIMIDLLKKEQNKSGEPVT